MGDSKRRKAEIDRLKASPHRKSEEALVKHGIDAASDKPRQTIAMARTLKSLFDKAKLAKKIDEPIAYLHSKAQSSIANIDAAIECKKGCSYCCHLWVSVSAPEVLHAANVVRSRGEALVARVRAADAVTKHYAVDDRFKLRRPCPLLEQNSCSIYESRPQACRFAASASALTCARSHLNRTDDVIPIPPDFFRGQIMYGYALAAALRETRLPYHLYEFNSALARALDADRAEERWLAGEDIFAGAIQLEGDVFAAKEAEFVFQAAFKSGA